MFEKDKRLFCGRQKVLNQAHKTLSSRKQKEVKGGGGEMMEIRLRILKI